MPFRIFSEKGLLHIEKEFPKLKFKGKGHEVSSPKMHDYNSTCTTFFSCVISFLQTSDLKYLLQQYEHWANSMYPKLIFKDVTDRIERLARTKEFKVRE